MGLMIVPAPRPRDELERPAMNPTTKIHETFFEFRSKSSTFTCLAITSFSHFQNCIISPENINIPTIKHKKIIKETPEQLR